MSSRQHILLITVLLSGLLCGTDLLAAPIVGVVASTNVPAGGGSDISHIVDGSGLFDPDTFVPLYTTAATHSRANADSVFVQGGSPPVAPTGSITFDLGGLFALDGMAVWNGNAGGNAAGVKDLSILGSIDGISFTPIVGAPSSFSKGANGGSELTELFSFISTASFVRFDILSNYGDIFGFGLNEVMFTGSPSPVPLPPSAILVASGLVILMIVTRGRRRRAFVNFAGDTIPDFC